MLVFGLNGTGPNDLSDMIQLHTPARPLRSLGKKMLVIPTVRTKHGEATLSFYAAQLWNQLPDDITGAPTVASFKSRLKTQLFSDQMLFVN